MDGASSSVTAREALGLLAELASDPGRLSPGAFDSAILRFARGLRVRLALLALVPSRGPAAKIVGLTLDEQVKSGFDVFVGDSFPASSKEWLVVLVDATRSCLPRDWVTVPTEGPHWVLAPLLGAGGQLAALLLVGDTEPIDRSITSDRLAQAFVGQVDSDLALRGSWPTTEPVSGAERIPVRRIRGGDDASGETPRSSGVLRSAAPSRGRTILLVEDDEMVRRVAVRVLTGSGYRVVEAASAADALARSRAHDGPIHLLLTDLVMPLMSGQDLAERLVPERPEIQVLFTSGYGETTVGPNSPYGAKFLGKPYLPSQLVALVEHLLQPEGQEKPV